MKSQSQSQSQSRQEKVGIWGVGEEVEGGPHHSQ